MKKLQGITKIYLESLNKQENEETIEESTVVSMFGTKHNAKTDYPILVVGPEDSKFKGYIFECMFTAYVSNDGIGSYEFWGSKEYDAGNDYVEEFDLYDYPDVCKIKNVENIEYPQNLVLKNSKDEIEFEDSMTFRDFCEEIGEDMSDENIKNVAKELSDLLWQADTSDEIKAAIEKDIGI